jgi:hypothetical protein
MIMRHIQDKDFDQLFRDRFESAEVEPSAGLWDKIEQKVEQKKKKSFPAYWMAAAVVFIAVAAGLVYIREEQHLARKPAFTKLSTVAPLKDIKQDSLTVVANNALAKAEKPRASTQVMNKQVPVYKPKVTDNSAAKVIDSRTAKVINNNAAKVVEVVKSSEAENTLLAMQPNRVDDHLTNKSQKIDVVLPVKKPAIKVEIPVLASVEGTASSDDEVINENEESGKKGIQNIGDLVNYVVDKVDKRDQKFLKFKTDDDDNSSLVAINIGFIKFNSKRHK